MNEKKYVDVVIATPGKEVCMQYLYSLINTIEYLNENEISWALTSSYNSHVGVAREETIRAVTNSDVEYKKIFWIDSDISWSVEDFKKLYLSDDDIISGVYTLYDETHNNGKILSFKIKRYKKINIEEIKNFEKKIEIDDTGFGFICIKKNVFDKFDENEMLYFSSFNYIDKETLEPMHMFSEDSSFCIKAKDVLNFKIFVDTNCLVSHYKNVKLSL